MKDISVGVLLDVCRKTMRNVIFKRLVSLSIQKQCLKVFKNSVLQLRDAMSVNYSKKRCVSLENIDIYEMSSMSTLYLNLIVLQDEISVRQSVLTRDEEKLNVVPERVVG